MIEKDVALHILKDIQENLLQSNEIQTLQTIQIYLKNLELTINKKIIQLIDQRREIIKKYGKNNKKVALLNKKIDKEIQKIFKD